MSMSHKGGLTEEPLSVRQHDAPKIDLCRLSSSSATASLMRHSTATRKWWACGVMAYMPVIRIEVRRAGVIHGHILMQHCMRLQEACRSEAEAD